MQNKVVRWNERKWQEKAALFDTHWRYNQEIEKETRSSRPTPHWPFPSSRHDPNTMEVDATSSRDTYLKEGHCFLCGKKGHIQHACLTVTVSKTAEDIKLNLAYIWYRRQEEDQSVTFRRRRIYTFTVRKQIYIVRLKLGLHKMRCAQLTLITP